MERDEAKADDYSDYNGSISVRSIGRNGEKRMERVQKATAELIDAVENSKEYVRYLEARQEMRRYPALKKKADAFCLRRYEMQGGGGNIFQEGDALAQEYAYLLDDSLVLEYLNAENAFCRLLRDINWQLLQTLDFEVDAESDGG